MMKHKIMQVMFERGAHRQLTAWVQIDDASLGGERHGGKAGQGRPNKVPFVAAVQTTESGAPKFVHFSQREFAKESIELIAGRSLASPATFVSNDLGCFAAVRGMGILHEPHITGGGAASSKRPSFLAVNTVPGNLKTALAGTCHSFEYGKHSHRYLMSHVQYLFNRRFDLRTTLTRLIRAACGTTVHRLEVLRVAEHA